MRNEELLKRIKYYEQHLERLFDAIPRAKKGQVFPSMSAVEVTGKNGIVAISLLAVVWPFVRDQWSGDADVARKVGELLGATGIT